MKMFSKEQYGPWALITGASSGIGREMAREVAGEGIHTVLVARDKAALETLCGELESAFHVSTRVIVADLAKAREIDRVIAECADLEIGLLVNCAGYAVTGAFDENGIEDELAMLSVNVTAPVKLSHVFSKGMKRRKRGGIIFVSSIMALGGAAGWAHYNATKAHNLLLSEGLGRELKPFNVNVTAVVPGPVTSGFQERSHTKSAFWAMPPQRVAKWGLWMLSCRRTYIPGIINKLIALSTRLGPRRVNTAVFSFVVNRLNAPRHA